MPVFSGERYGAFSIYQAGNVGRISLAYFIDFLIGNHPWLPSELRRPRQLPEPVLVEAAGQLVPYLSIGAGLYLHPKLGSESRL